MSISSLIIDIYENQLKLNDSNILLLIDNTNSIWFSYNDILNALGYKDAKTQKKRLALDSKYFDTFKNIKSNSNNLNNINILQQKHKMINESGLYVLLNRSTKTIAKELSERLFADVLPELRKKGKFELNNADKKKMKTLTNKIKLYQQELKLTKKQSHPDKTGHGFIYVIKVKTIQNGENKTCYKIGYTANLEKRLKTYRTGNPDIELVHQENLKCNKKQLESCILNLNILKRLKNKTEVICDVPLEKIKEEIEDCKKLLEKYSNTNSNTNTNTNSSTK
jgi:prophage antirepressor-like protein